MSDLILSVESSCDETAVAVVERGRRIRSSVVASQVALHGTLAALIERERSGAGQWVETNLVQAFTTLDTWAFFEHFIADRWPDAFVKSDSYDAEGRPASPLTFMLLVCLTQDGRWLQFASVAPHLFAATMKALGLDWMFTAPEWQGLPVFGDDADKRMALWTKMLESARGKTLAEWNAWMFGISGISVIAGILIYVISQRTRRGKTDEELIELGEAEREISEDMPKV